jgi:hypothetical protein
LIPTCRCPYCQRIFQLSPYRLQQRVCSQPDCQRRRSADYHRRKIQTDSLYADVVKDSRKTWREEHPGYQKAYWQAHPETAERNRQGQRQRDRRRRVGNLVKNNLALDLKHSASEIWLVGPETADLVKNNVAFSEVLVFQRVPQPPQPPAIL